MYSFRQRKTF